MNELFWKFRFQDVFSMSVSYSVVQFCVYFTNSERDIKSKFGCTSLSTARVILGQVFSIVTSGTGIHIEVTACD